jgi:predicted  nucleic acid-binding Zn-ribbon protein
MSSFIKKQKSSSSTSQEKLGELEYQMSDVQKRLATIETGLEKLLTKLEAFWRKSPEQQNSKDLALVI